MVGGLTIDAADNQEYLRFLACKFQNHVSVYIYLSSQTVFMADSKLITFLSIAFSKFGVRPRRPITAKLYKGNGYWL